MFRLVTITLSILTVVTLFTGACRSEATLTPTVAPVPKTVVAPPPTTTPMPVSQALPKTVSLTSWAAGSTSYVAGLAMGSVLSKYAGIKGYGATNLVLHSFGKDSTWPNKMIGRQK